LTKRTAATVLVGCSSWWCSTPAVRRRWRRSRRWLPMYSKELLEEIAGSWRRSGNSAGHRGASSAHFTLRIRFRFNIRRCVRTRYLRGGSLRLVRSFFVLASQIASLFVISHRSDHLQRIGFMCGCEPGHLHVEFAFI